MGDATASGDKVSITLPDGSVRTLGAGATGADLAADIGPGLAKAALAVDVDGELRDLSRPLPDGATVSIVKGDGEQGLDLMRHSTAHVMAQAVMDVFGSSTVRLGIGPTIKNGFYYDFDFVDDRHIKEEDLAAIEARMGEIIAADQRFVREEVTREQALETWGARDDRFKCELIAELEDPISFYFNAPAGTQGADVGADGDAFVDLCLGPHVPSTGRLKVFYKLLSVAGAYWRGDEKNPMMQRVYAACFADKKALKKHLGNLEEASKRDHRKLGKQLKLFHFTDRVGPGLPLWLPRGAQVLETLVDFLKAEQRKRGYQTVSTPHIGRLELYKTSGHWFNYRDSMFPLLGDEELGAFALKPMNCPHHVEIYKSDARSYRELPLRLAEFGTVYRYEKSGELGGLKRVRGFTVDDAHLFVTPDQLQDEFKGVVELVRMVLNTLTLDSVEARVGTRDNVSDKWVGELDQWERAQAEIIEACEEMGLDFVVEEGEAAFYGPKLDFVVTDALDREWQLGTVQVDYNLPERFDLEYTAKDGKRERPIMIHRAPFGSLERLMGVYIEHVAGAFPVWLAPVQVSVAPLTDDQLPAARELATALEQAGHRVHRSFENEPIGPKIKRARLEKIPYVAILGPREIDSSTVSVRSREEGELDPMTWDDFLGRLATDVAERR